MPAHNPQFPPAARLRQRPLPAIRRVYVSRQPNGRYAVYDLDAEQFAYLNVQPADVYVIFREELPEGEELLTALRDGFGAEPGDEIVEVLSGRTAGSWRIARQSLPLAA